MRLFHYSANVLFYRLLIFNVIACAWLVGTDMQTSWFTTMLAHDSSHATWAIIGWFLFTGFMLWRMANRVDYLLIDPYIHQEEALIINEKIGFFEWAAGAMFVLGLIGTVMGLGISLSGVSAQSMASVEGIKNIGTNLVVGIRTELAATIVGAIFGLWAEANYQIVRYRAVELLTFED